MASMTGRVHSIQSLGALDGPGIRFVVFLQGCNLHCDCCHNPDTWASSDGKSYTASEIVQKAVRYREYFGEEGGITLSGGEPLLQPEFVGEIFSLCHKEGIHTCLDTSGSVFGDAVEKLLGETDRVLLDLKYACDSLYRQHVGCDIERVLRFLAYLNEKHIPVTLRQVIIPTLNDDRESVLALRSIAKEYPCVDKIELLPFRKLCQTKYDSMGKIFPFAHLPEPKRETMLALEQLVIE